jgi:hypothetical protein
MPLREFLASHLIHVLLAAAVAGLVVRRRTALCWTFFCYLLVVLTCSILIAQWPDRFWNLEFHSGKETVYFVLKALIAVELWRRIFATLPRARVRVGLGMVGVLLSTAAMVGSTPTEGRHSFAILVGILAPRQQAGSLALFALVVAAAWWYRAPLHPLHRAILGGFSVYLPISTLVQTVLGWYVGSEDARPWSWGVNVAAYTLTSAWWAWAAWRPVRAPEPIIGRLQPWAHSW